MRAAEKAEPTYEDYREGYMAGIQYFMRTGERPSVDLAVKWTYCRRFALWALGVKG